jgi:GAF domain-containing protein
VKAEIDPGALGASLRRLENQREPAVLEQSLKQLVTACVELFGMGGSGVMLADEHGELRYAVATDPASQELEDAQLATGQGPCVDTYVNDELIASADMYTDARWPRFTERLARHRVRGVLGVPVKLSGITVGSLDVFRDGRHDWDESERQALSRYADIGGALLTAAVAAEHSSELAAQLTYAIQHRAPIERGVGYLMARDRIGQGDAFNRLRTAARSSRRKIGDVAQDLLRTGRLPDERC